MDERVKGSFVGGLKGSHEGMAAGSVGGPWGMVIGGIAGGVMGNVTGWMSADSKMKAEKKRRAAWEKAQRLLQEARIRADNQRRQALQTSFAPANNTMMSAYGADANMMGSKQSYAPRAVGGK